GIEPFQLAGIFAAEVDVEPRGLRDAVEAGAAAETNHGMRGAWGVGRGDRGDKIDRSSHRVRRIRHTIGGPGVSAGTRVGHVIPAGAEGTVDDALDAGAVEGDEGGRADSRTAGRPEQMTHAAQIP